MLGLFGFYSWALYKKKTFCGSQFAFCMPTSGVHLIKFLLIMKLMNDSIISNLGAKATLVRNIIGGS